MKKTIIIIPTYYCNFSCSHCGIRRSSKKLYISLSNVEKLFRIIKSQKISSIWLTGGGEPSIDFEKMIKIIRLASKHGSHSQLVTNASFVLKGGGYKNIKILKDAGLERLDLSIDDYHLKFISYSSIIKTIKSALRLNLTIQIKMTTTKEVKEINFALLKKMVKDLGGKLIKVFPFDVWGMPSYIILLKRKSITVYIYF